jgi:hypothetical protein
MMEMLIRRSRMKFINAVQSIRALKNPGGPTTTNADLVGVNKFLNVCPLSFEPDSIISPRQQRADHFFC